VRVLRVDLPSGAVELHPFVTVVRGLSPAAREALLNAVEAAARGKAVVPGLLEAYGVLLDLDAPTLQLLDLVDDVEPIVRATDLPGEPGGLRLAEADRAVSDAARDAAAATAAVERAERALDGARAALDGARAAASAAFAGDATSGDPLAQQRAELQQRTIDRADVERVVQEAVAADRAAARAVHDADAAAEAARTARADATRALSVAAAALEAATDRRDPMATAAVEAARAALAEAEAAVVAARASEGDVEPAPALAVPTPEEVAALRAERVEAEAGILALETVDPSPVRLAVEQLASGAANEPVPDPRALTLAERWAELEVDLRHASDADDVDDDLVGGAALAAARARLAEAEAAVAAVEAGMRAPVLDPADIHALESAHAAVQAARDAQEKRFGKGAAGKRLAEAEEAEAELLHKVGFATFTDYLLGQRGEVDLDAGQRLDAARTELTAATRQVRELEAAVAVELRRAELLDRRRELRAAAVELLGDDLDEHDVAGALRRRRVPATETGEHLARLRSALEATGLVLGDEELPERTLVDLAGVWLEEQQRAAEERARLEQRVGELDARLAEAARLQAAGTRGDDSAAVTSPLAAALAAVDEARAAVGIAEARLFRHHEAEAEVEERRAAFEHAAAVEAAAVAALTAAEAAQVDTRTAERSAAVVAVAAERELGQARAAETAAAELLADLEARLAGPAPDQIAAIEDDVARATAELNAARTAAARAAADLDAARSARTAAAADDGDAGDAGGTADAEDAEWFLLARLAAQRAVSYAGSVPLVLDDALAGFDPEPTRRLLDRLERMASTVQVVVVTEDLTTAAWAESLGPERAAVVEP
jgi:hypothetical protein